MSPPPVVTGVSPKEGPPGTRVTIRGEHLGNSPNDIIGLIICNSDCLLSAEWISSTKIVARSGPGKGKGEIIIITKSGGKGTCTVQFRGYHETIGPLKESAVWVDESHLSGVGRHRALVPSTYQQEDPLGLSVESTVKKYPEEELQELFPDSNGEFGSENFSPSWFLLQNHHSTSFDDLKAGLSFLKRRVEAQKESQISFLKAHAGSVVEQLDTLIDLKEVVEENKKQHGYDMTASLENSICMAKQEANRLFDDVLKRKDEADGTRNALGVLHRFRFLFNLPAVIDKNIQKSDYDLVINDYARANNLYRNSEVQIFKRVLQEAERKILNLRELLMEKLQCFPSTLEEQKKIIRNLVNLESPIDPAWLCITGQYKYCLRILFECKDKFIIEDQEQAARTALALKNKKIANATGGITEPAQSNVIPVRISFIEDLNERFGSVFPELWKLGQAYFSKELYVRVEPSKQDEFKTMSLDIVTIYSQIIRAALLPHTLDRHSPHRAQFGLWSNFSTNPEQESVGSWLVHCLRYMRTSYSELLILELPDSSLDVMRDLLHDLRVHCMRTLLMQSMDNVTQLANKENWNMEFIESHGCITQFPHLFETQVIECLQLIKETILFTDQRETSLLDSAPVLNDLNILVQKLLVSFAKNTERIIMSEQDQSDESTRRMKLLLGLSNCHYTAKIILPRLSDHWNVKLGYPDLSVPIQSAKELLLKTEETLMRAYFEEKVDVFIGMVELSMYARGFSWNKNMLNDDVRPYCKEIIMNMVEVHAEVAHICPSLVSRILGKVVQEVAAELGRLFSCVTQFSNSGALQAKADISALSRACRNIKASEKSSDSTSRGPFAETADIIPEILTQNDQERLTQILASFEEKMKFPLFCLRIC